MTLLVDAGVVDTGAALCMAARWGGNEPAVKFLLGQHQEETKPIGEGAYVNTRDFRGSTPLLNAVRSKKCRSSRVVRMLLDAGADAASTIRIPDDAGGKGFDYTPLALLTEFLRETEADSEDDSTEEQLNSLEGIRRLLLQVEAVHAMSWLWHVDAPSATDASSQEKLKINNTSTPLMTALPTIRRRARRRGVVLVPHVKVGGVGGGGAKAKYQFRRASLRFVFFCGSLLSAELLARCLVF